MWNKAPWLGLSQWQGLLPFSSNIYSFSLSHEKMIEANNFSFSFFFNPKGRISELLPFPHTQTVLASMTRTLRPPKSPGRPLRSHVANAEISVASSQEPTLINPDSIGGQHYPESLSCPRSLMNSFFFFLPLGSIWRYFVFPSFSAQANKEFIFHSSSLLA